MIANDQFYFLEEFQDLILACLLRAPAKFAAIGHLLKPEYFWGNHAAKLCEMLQEYHEKHRTYPAFSAVGQYTADQYGRENTDLAGEMLGYLKKLSKLNTRDWHYVRDRLVFFCRERALIKAIQDSSAQIKTGQWPESGFAPLFDHAMRVGQDVENLGFRMVEDADKVIDMITSVNYGVKTGYTLLDEVWPVGWGRGWLVSILAPPKSYKTTFALNLALNMTSKFLGKNAVNIHYYACEISAELALARAYCRVAKQSMKTLYKDTERFRASMHEGLAKSWKGGAGNFLAKSFPSKGASIADIRAHALNAIEALEWEPRVIFIDHAETIRAPKTGRDMSDWRAQAEVYTQARALAQELDCVVVLPDRCNKETVDRDVPSMTSFQGSFEKAGIVDVAIGLCQTEIERTKNEIRYFNFVNRHGDQFGYWRGKVTPDHMKMSLTHPLDFEMERKKYEEEKQERRTGNRKARGAAKMPQELEH